MPQLHHRQQHLHNKLESSFNYVLEIYIYFLGINKRSKFFLSFTKIACYFIHFIQTNNGIAAIGRVKRDYALKNIVSKPFL